ncbi:preprotein translocase subunit SecE [Butyrivibrio sp. MC2013]|uniref:preprotein translocase subunit SecE n=1 Tax=Butyrivibrio sp. MC2013 TaxID=1280686 RepID=UPI00042609D2|nr:preprotein translocase subunit SecE [Butyrivibrio sp. MC2013]
MGESNNTVESTSSKKSANSSDKKVAGDKVKSFWAGLKAEFGKIVWPSRETVGKQTVAVVVVCIVVGALIAALDYGFEAGLNFLQNL